MADIVRLRPGDRVLARETFRVMAAVFESETAPLGDAYVDRLLSRDDFWALTATIGDQVAGGLTAHTLPMTTAETSEVFIYDLAVGPDYQRRGIGRALVAALRAAAAAAGIHVSFVPADNDDAHALEFYRALGGAATAVTVFTFSDDQD